MCVHVLCVRQMPDSTLVWVRRHASHFVVYTDSSLVDGPGRLTDDGVAQVSVALAAAPGAPSLESAKPCGTALL